MKLIIKHNPHISHPYLVQQDIEYYSDETKHRRTIAQQPIFDEDLVTETLAWARERGLNVLVARGWRGDPYAFAFVSEAEAEYFMLGRNQYAE